ncbi:DUF192 domain-containing protein [Rhizobium sp. KVB221]|uniref:DUF192 domain-containing protein n=1 Tax=Rhizobium setariae TaxID=2801340 RepID=A0A936YSN1_9HYPH|nr:DUF192 domain-containing protein [Rhizobium setariae]MBL0375048.1 DUF192 domain-containing protein [Rhizobium setariae]
MRKHRFELMKGAFVALFCILAPATMSHAGEFRTESLEIRTAAGKVQQFTVELATTEAERSLGLMNRKEMASDRGMLFDFGESRLVYMWMKNTYLPLDMLFISESGRIELIQPDRQPLSENIIDSRQPVRFVLELNGGAAAEQGIRAGDMVKSATISRAAPPQ